MTDAAPSPELQKIQRLIGHAGTALVGALLVVGGVASALTDLPLVFAIALLIFGAAALVLAYASWHGSRIGWAFAVVLDGVMALCNLFGSTKIAHLAGIPIGPAILPCVIAAVSCVMLAMVSADYDK